MVVGTTEAMQKPLDAFLRFKGLGLTAKSSRAMPRRLRLPHVNCIRSPSSGLGLYSMPQIAASQAVLRTADSKLDLRPSRTWPVCWGKRSFHGSTRAKGH